MKKLAKMKHFVCNEQKWTSEKLKRKGISYS